MLIFDLFFEGSIRIPSCWNGVVGFKPTHGLAPYTGVYSMEATLDNVGMCVCVDEPFEFLIIFSA